MLPGGYWDVTIPAALETSGADSPAMLAYLAAQNRLGAPVLLGMRGSRTYWILRWRPSERPLNSTTSSQEVALSVRASSNRSGSIRLPTSLS